eukprot:1836730-Lingulodinium_polyedra.AAC.1
MFLVSAETGDGAQGYGASPRGRTSARCPHHRHRDASPPESARRQPATARTPRHYVPVFAT